MLSRYETVLAALDAGVVIHGPDTAIIDANDRARQLLGITDLKGRLASDPSWVFLEADLTRMPLERFPVVQAIATRGPVLDLVVVVRPPEGPDVWVEVNALPRLDDSGELVDVAVTFIDITSREQRQRAAESAHQRLQELIDGAPLGIALIDDGWTFADTNESWRQIFGRCPVGTAASDVIPEEQMAVLTGSGAASSTSGAVSRERLEWSVPTEGDHREVLVEVTRTTAPESGTVTILFAVDLTERHRLEEQLRLANRNLTTLSMQDPLTGLFNRRAILSTLETAIAHCSRHREPLSILMVDLDHFKAVNDSRGHARGDEVLQNLARGMERILRDEDSIGRYGGEEFLVVLPGADQSTATDIAQRIRLDVESLAREDSVTASLGVAERKPGEAPQSLIARADRALYAAKAGGRNLVHV